MTRTATAMATVLLLAATPAWAQTADGTGSGTLEERITAGLIARELRDQGYTVKVDKDDDGDPRITTSIDSREMQIWFYGCAQGELEERRCEAIQFFARFQTGKPIPLTALNKWNTEERYAKVYSYRQRSGRVDTHMEVDVRVSDIGAPPTRLFRTYFQIMKDKMEKFGQTLGK